MTASVVCHPLAIMFVRDMLLGLDRINGINSSVLVRIVLCFGVEFLCCLHLAPYVSFHILVKFVWLGSRLLENSNSLG